MNKQHNNVIIDEKNQNHGGYGATLFDPRWKAKRKEILDRDNNKGISKNGLFFSNSICCLIFSCATFYHINHSCY